MYEYISGKIEELTPASVVIECSGIGYFIGISLQTYSSLESQTETKIYIHQYLVRDDLPVFYGFSTKSERDIFRLLIGVSGVGGNTARMILSTFTATELREIISTGKSNILKSVKGLGAKTSEKIIVELRDKIISVDVSGLGDSSSSISSVSYDDDIYNEALAALTMLGFAKAASGKVVKNILSDNPGATVEDVIRMSLKKL